MGITGEASSEALSPDASASGEGCSHPPKLVGEQLTVALLAQRVAAQQEVFARRFTDR
jgi:hypothetical protein